MSSSDFRLFLFFFLLCLAFCGDPDLHDAAISNIQCEGSIRD